MSDSRFNSILKRGVAEVIIETELLTLLKSGRTINFKQGFDPSAPDIHLGHVVGLKKLRQFQDLGHKVTLIVGDWTARIGDPSGQSVTRPMLTQAEIEANARTYMEQFFKVVDKNKTEVTWQSEWYAQFTLDDVIKLTSRFTVAQLLAREDFNNRYTSGNPISMTEMLYPLLQAYDSVVIKSDVEFGGTDQKFNCLLGRELQQMMGQSPQQVFLVPLLIGTDGNLKMSKSLNNHIGVTEAPVEIYGKVMSIPDTLIMDYFELVTDIPDEEIAELSEQLKTHSANPMTLKKRLAHEIVELFHDKPAADTAQEHFIQVFQKRETPEEIPEYSFTTISGEEGKREGTGEKDSKNYSVAKPPTGDELYQVDIMPTLVKEKLVKSNNELKRLLVQESIELDGKKISNNIVNARQGSILKIGKRRFVKIIIE